MTVITDVEMLGYEIDQDIDFMEGLYFQLDSMNGISDIGKPSVAAQELSTVIRENFNRFANLDNNQFMYDVYHTEASMEGIKEFGERAYSAIAEIIAKIIKWVKTLFNMTDKEVEAAAKDVDEDHEAAKTYLKTIDSSIGATGHEPGDRVSDMDAERFKNATGKGFIRDKNDAIRSKRDIEHDVITGTLTPGEIKKFANIYQVNGKGVSPVEAYESSYELINKVIPISSCDELMAIYSHIEKLNSAADVHTTAETIRELLQTHTGKIESAFGIKGSSKRKTAKDFGLYKNFTLEVAKGKLGTTRVKLTKKSTKPNVKGMERVSMADMETCTKYVADLATAVSKLKHNSEGFRKMAENVSVGKGAYMKNASAKLNRLRTNANAQDIAFLVDVLRNLQSLLRGASEFIMIAIKIINEQANDYRLFSKAVTKDMK